MITSDGQNEYIFGKKIYSKKVESDPDIPGHIVLTVRTYDKEGTHLQSTVELDLYNTAEACVEHNTKLYKNDVVHKFRVARVFAEFDEQEKRFYPVIVGIDGKEHRKSDILVYMKP